MTLNRMRNMTNRIRSFGSVGVITRTIDPDGTGDYLGLALWYADMVSNYVSPVFSNSVWVAECIRSGATEDTLTAQLDIDADSDSSRKIVIQAGVGHTANGKWNPSIYILGSNGFSADLLDINTPYVEFLGLQIQHDYASGEIIDWSSSAATNGLISGCMLDGEGAARRAIRWANASGVGARAINTVAFDCGGAGPTFDAASGSNPQLDFCTATGANGGVGFDNALCTNCLSSGNTGSDFANCTGDYNAAEDATAPGANSRQSQTFTFNDAGSDDYRLGAGDTGAQDHGTPIADVLTDIAGVVRGPNPSIGACEVA